MMDAIRRSVGGNALVGKIEMSPETYVDLEFTETDSQPDVVGGNPFADQRIHRGLLRYREPDAIEGMPPNEEEHPVQYREGSELFVIENFDDYSRLSNVITTLISESPDFRLGKVRSSRLGVWSFVFSAHNQPEIRVRDYEENEFVEKDLDKELQALTQKEIAEQSSLYSATLIFDVDGEDVNVRYTDGSISFADPPSDTAREYVLQRIEKHIIGDIPLDSLRGTDVTQ